MPQAKQQAFMEAYRACHEPFMRYCSAVVQGKMATEDLVQDVLLSAYKNYDSLRKDTPLLHYLIRAARNRKVSLWRKSKYRAELVEDHAERLRSTEIPADVLLDIQLLYRLVRKLPEAQGDALLLYEINGFSMKEIATIQESTEGAVKTKISRGRKLLKQMLIETESQDAMITVKNSRQ